MRSLQQEGLKIRPVVEKDLPGLVNIFNAARRSAGCFREEDVSIENFRKQTEGEAIVVAEGEEGILGFASVWEPENFIHHLYVSPEFQGQGIGSYLIRACIGKFGLPISLKCNRCNQKAQAFYRRNGWKANKEGVGEFGPWDHLFLEREQ